MSSSLTYRPDIDGLRALAVLPVVFYHAGLSWTPGGFVGVDIFFVISGYLITSIIARDIAAGTFSILHFYERRVRRIFPALFAVVLATFLVGGWLLLPTDYDNLGQSAAAASLFVANIFFWWTVDYFGATDVQPLLHTWSLAVEEQFYLIFPPLLMVLYAVLKQRWIWPLLVLLAGSFALSAWTVTHAPLDAFYLPHLRAWELLIGAVLALGVLPDVRSRLLQEATGLAGIALIVWAVLFTDAESFPGPAALAPCLGAALVIHARGRIVAWVLWLRPLVAIRLISYSLYLWHWPILQFAAYYTIFPLEPEQTWMAIGASFAAAILSYLLIETPFRRTRRSRRVVLASGAGMTAAALAASALVVVTAGFPARLPPDTLRVAGMMDLELYFPIYDRGGCFLNSNQRVEDYDLDRCAPPGDRPSVLIWGDSFAANLYPGLASLGEAAGIDVRQYTATSCRPLPVGNARCQAVYDGLPAVLEHLEPDLVIVAGFWSTLYGRLGAEEFMDLATSSVARASALVGTDRVLLVGQSPVYNTQVPRLGFLRPDMLRTEEALYLSRGFGDLNIELAELAGSAGIGFHDYFDACEDLLCTAFLDGEPLHWDNGHMTMTGSLHYARGLLEQIEERLAIQTAARPPSAEAAPLQ